MARRGRLADARVAAALFRTVGHKGVALPFDYRDDLDVEWMGRPDWFFRVSKFGIPGSVIRGCRRRSLSDVNVSQLPANRDGLLLKPLFSFAGGIYSHPACRSRCDSGRSTAPVPAAGASSSPR